MKKIALLMAAFLCTFIGHAQSDERSEKDSTDSLRLTSKDSIVISSWMTSLGWNFVNDAGSRFDQPLKIKDRINAVAFPSRASIGRYFRSGLGIELIATYNNYKEGNIIDGIVNTEDKDYFGIDSRVSYDLNKILGQTGFFDPYLGLGLGYTHANDVGRGTYNAVVGFRTWFNDRWALDFNTSGKWSFGNEASNHVQHAVGVIYQFKMEKALSRKGLEKLALIEALEEERMRIRDSIAAAKKAEEDALALAEEMAREKEALEKESREAELRRKESILKALKDMGYVYFGFDSSSLNEASKEVLDSLVKLMNQNPDLIFTITAYADSRGPAKYNMRLSENRAQQVVDYITNKGISPNRAIGRGYGEEKPVNRCKDGVLCSKAEHAANRRSEFEIQGW